MDLLSPLSSDLFEESESFISALGGLNKETASKLIGPIRKRSIWWRVLAILSSANAFLYSDIEHDQNGNRYDYLWTTYEELQEIYTLLQNPEALYDHLKKISTSIIDKPTFLEQYKEYDQKPYSMRHMAKTVLDRGKENYPDSDNEKMLKKCQELVERVARQVEAEKNADKE